MDSAVRAELLGLPFDRTTMGGALSRCLAWCDEPRASHVVITANASHLCMMRRDPALRSACAAGDLIVADGMSTVWALRLARLPLPERVPGVDLMARLLEAGARRGLRVFFLGARPEVVSKLAADCATRYPGIVVAGFHDGYFTAADHERIAEPLFVMEVLA